jgi:hypothetical protein
MQDFDGSNNPAGLEAVKVQRRCDIGMAIIACLMFIAICAMSTTDVLWPGDAQSDVMVIMAGENFAKYGFVRLHFLPVFQVGPLSDKPWYYLHAPPLSSIINGLLQKCGVHSLMWMRIFCGTFFVLGSICIYRAFSRMIGPFASVCGLGFLASTLFFFTFAVSLHQQAYSMFFLGLFFLFFFRGIECEEPAKGTWLCCWLVLFLNSLLSFEFILLPQVFAWIYVLATGQIRRRWRLLVVLGLAPVAGVGLHFLQNCWAIGWSTAVRDNMGFTKRDLGGITERLNTMRKIPKMVHLRSLRYFYFTWSFISVLAVLLYALRRRISPHMWHRTGPLLLGLLISSYMWYLFMPSQSLKHEYTVNQLTPVVIVVIGCTISVMLGILLKRDTRLWGKVLVGLVLLGLVLNNIYMLKPRLVEKGKSGKRLLLRAIGSNGLPTKAGYLFKGELPGGPYFTYFTRRPAWYPTIGTPARMVSVIGVPHNIPGLKGWSNDTLPDPNFLTVLQSCVPEDWPIRYLVFYSKGDYTNDKLFRSLAVTCLGKKKEFILGGQDETAVLILFDISPLHLPEVQRSALDPQVKESQLGGTFAEWDIPGFDQRLKDITHQKKSLWNTLSIE